MAGKKTSAFGSLPDAVKPREQLRDAPSAAAIPDESLLAILLKTGSPGCDVVSTARRILAAAGSPVGLVRSDWRALLQRVREYNTAHPEAPVKGFGPVKAMELQAAFELVRRAYETDGADDIRNIRIETPEDACRVFRRSAIAGDRQENFFVLPLDTKRRPLCSAPVRVTRGTLDGAPVHAREVFKCAVSWDAQSVILAHNHPSGDPSPSRADVETTDRLVAASKIMGIPVVDHIILGRAGAPGGGFVSMRREGLVQF